MTEEWSIVNEPVFCSDCKYDNMRDALLACQSLA